MSILFTRFRPFISPGRMRFQKEQNIFFSHKKALLRNHSNGHDDQQIISIRRKKKIFGFALFSSTLLLVYYLKRKRQIKQFSLLKECIRLPIQKDLFSNEKRSFYRYKGFIFPDTLVHAGILEDLKNFTFQQDDVIVASFPKSGTTWVQEITYMLLNNCKRSDSNSEILETRFPYLEYPYPGMKTIEKMSGRRFIKTHLPYSILPESFHTSGAKLIYIYRNPRDVVISYWYFMKMLTIFGFLGSFNEFVSLFLADEVPYGPYFEHLHGYHEQKRNPNILIIAYEDLKRNPLQIIEKISTFLEVPVDDNDILEVAASTTFASMSNNPSVNYEHWKDLGFSSKDGKFLRKGVIGDWKTHFTPVILKQFEEWEEAKEASKYNLYYG